MHYLQNIFNGIINTFVTILNIRIIPYIMNNNVTLKILEIVFSDDVYQIFFLPLLIFTFLLFSLAHCSNIVSNSVSESGFDTHFSQASKINRFNFSSLVSSFMTFFFWRKHFSFLCSSMFITSLQYNQWIHQVDYKILIFWFFFRFNFFG